MTKTHRIVPVSTPVITRVLGSKEVLSPSTFGSEPSSSHFQVYPAWTTARFENEEVRVYAFSDAEVGGRGFIRQGGTILLPDDCFPGWFEPVLRGEWNPVARVWFGALLEAEARVIELSHPCATALNPNLVYGHFLLEMLPRLHLLGVLRSLGIELPLLLPRQAPEWVLTFVLLYMREDELIWYDATCERVWAPTLVVPSMMHRGYDFHPAMCIMVDDLKARVGLPISKGPGIRRLYLSRRRLPSTGWHRVLNEAEVETVFAENGFEILHPQEMTIQEQLLAYDEAAVLGGEYGSAMHNAIFCRPGAKILVINEINKVQERIAALRHQQLIVVPPADGVLRKWETHVEDGEYIVDLVALDTSLRDLIR